MAVTQIRHHGAANGVTGSCHELVVGFSNETSHYLIDCGLFQGAETAHRDPEDMLAIDFPVEPLQALLVTHCHIDHVGRIPYLLAAGFKGPIYCSVATAQLLPEVIEDALKVAGLKGKQISTTIMRRLRQQIVAVEYNQWLDLPQVSSRKSKQYIRARFQVAGHILGSAFIEFDVKENNENERIIFSGDLGACYTPLLPAPKPPYRCDQLVIESTYGDKNHQGRKKRRKVLGELLRRCINDRGIVLIPAFSIGRTQELLYEIEEILHRLNNKEKLSAGEKILNQVDVIVDSPLAAKFTDDYRSLKQCWDKEAHQKLKQGRHPLSFEQLTTIDSHQQHLDVMNYLQRNQGKVPAIIIAASGMCSGGRIVNYIKRFIQLPTTDILFVGYQARGTLGRLIQQYGPAHGYVHVDGQKLTINADVHTISGYSAHADQHDLIRFIKRMQVRPKRVVIVHGDNDAKEALKGKILEFLPECKVMIGQQYEHASL